MNPAAAASTPARPSLLQRFLGGLARLGLIAAMTFLLALALLTLSPFIATALESLIAPETKLPRLVAILILCFLVIVPLLLFWLARRKHWGESWPTLAIGYAVLAPVFVWLAWDETTIRHSVSLDELCPPGPQAAESWAVTLAYTPRDGHPAARTATTPKFQMSGNTPENPEKWTAFLEKNRADIHETWATLPERAWWAELNAFPVIGDLMPARPDAPIIRFKAYRTLIQVGCAEAGLLALDGKGDEAMDTLLPVLEGSRKLEPSARSLVRFMVARVGQRMCLHTARYILARTPVSPDRRARLAAVLRGGSGGPSGARRLLFIEYAVSGNHLLSLSHPEQSAGWKARVLPAALRFVFNPVATVNRYGAMTEELAGLAERRDLAGFNRRMEEFSRQNSHPPFKNLAGQLMLSWTIPAYTKVLESYWKTEDLRTALAKDVGP